MESWLIREQYKVTDVLAVREDYAALLAVDIQDREKNAYLLNVYEGQNLKPAINLFSALEGCPAYCGMFLAGKSLVTVFSDQAGQTIDQIWYKGASHSWKERLDAAQQLLGACLRMANYPPEICCGLLFSENIRSTPDGLRFRYLLPPLEGASEREWLLLIQDQLEKLLLPRWYRVRAELDFMDWLEQQNAVSIARLYGKWSQARPEIEQEYEQMDAKSALGRNLRLAWQNLTHWRRQRRAKG